MVSMPVSKINERLADNACIPSMLGLPHSKRRAFLAGIQDRVS